MGPLLVHSLDWLAISALQSEACPPPPPPLIEFGVVIVSLLLNARQGVELEDETVPVPDYESWQQRRRVAWLRGTGKAHMPSGEQPPTKGCAHSSFSLAVKPGEFVLGGSSENAQTIFLFDNQIFKTRLGKRSLSSTSLPLNGLLWGGGVMSC